MTLPAGTRFGAYEILGPIGAGGMGEVYLAQDLRLGRKVAVKLLSEGLAADDDARRRFAHEARAASNLNHPNIVTIYDIGCESARDYIAMEYVEGESLRRILSGDRVELRRALEMTAQAASALGAAHEAGIVHRDIKPENLILVKPKGHTTQLKVLDFGLAKLIEKRLSGPPAGDAETLTDVGLTTPGAILGTVAYMSPEQAAGREVDHRTDIFSLGLVLYELLTWRPAFRGSSTVDTLYAIIHNEPPPVRDLNPRLPSEVVGILEKALAKDPAERYHHAGDFELDLRRLNRAHSSTPAPGPKQESLGKKAIWVAAAAAAIVVAFLLGSGLNRSAVPAGGLALDQAKLVPLTGDGRLAMDPSLSPDGETFVYCSDRTGNFEIFLKQASGGRDVNLTNNTADDVQPAFSPDGKQIAFVSSREGSPEILDYGPGMRLMGGGIWVMAALGGNTRRIVASGSFPSWTPDGLRIAYTSGTWFRSKIYTVPATGGESQEVPVQFPAGVGASQFFCCPRYSPDGKWITFEVTGETIWVVAAQGGMALQVAHGQRPVWDADSGAIIYSNAETGRNYSLWQQPFSSVEGKVTGNASPVTIGRGWDTPGSVSRDGKRIAFSAIEETFNLERLPFDAETGRVTGPPRPITTGNQRISFFSISPDSRSVVFDSRRGAETHIWRVDTDAAAVQLTSDPSFNDTFPAWSPDGRLISFLRSPVKEENGGAGSWLMAADGANPRLLIDGAGSNGVGSGRWTPDGSRLVYRQRKDQQIHLFDMASKTSRRLTNEPAVMPVFNVSPDGKWVVYQSTQSGNVDLRAVSTGGGESRIVSATGHHAYHPFFSPTGRWLYFLRDHKNLWRVPGAAQNWRRAEPEKATHFPESGFWIEDPQVSHDGRQLIYAKGQITGDIWLLNRSK